ncbi:MAG: putative cysteine desulfurase, partial [Labilithrix sp.]|nr:putative cysteine desulfurase [Labilithrix sp.]
MSTPDPKGGQTQGLPPVGEVSLLTAHLPRTTETPNYPSAAATSTPGIALAAARVPGGPTLPELDPLSFTNAISQLANQIWAAPSPPMTSAPGSMDTSALSSPPTALAPSPPAAHALAPPAALAPSPPAAGRSDSRFHAAPNFDWIERPVDPSFGTSVEELLRFPLQEPTTASALPATPAEPRFALDVFEITPVGDPSLQPLGHRIFDPNVLRKEFPILSEPVRGKRLVWLDNAATTQKPKAVIDRLQFFYEHENSNIHRAAHTLAAKATDAYESARESVRRFINAPSPREIVFVRGTTEGINLVAQSYGRRNVSEGDEIVITWLEHHANIVPWQQLCSEKRARLRVAPVDDRGEVILEEYEKLLGPKTKLVSFTAVSNALGTVTKAKEMIAMAHRHGALVVLDGAQSISHMPVDVQDLGCDFFVFSGHKVFGPTGIGALFGRAELLDAMPPWQGGGDMILTVNFDETTYQETPHKFEAGTPDISGAIGLGMAIDYIEAIGRTRIQDHEERLTGYGVDVISAMPGVRLIPAGQ